MDIAGLGGSGGNLGGKKSSEVQLQTEIELLHKKLVWPPSPRTFTHLMALISHTPLPLLKRQCRQARSNWQPICVFCQLQPWFVFAVECFFRCFIWRCVMTLLIQLCTPDSLERGQPTCIDQVTLGWPCSQTLNCSLQFRTPMEGNTTWEFFEHFTGNLLFVNLTGLKSTYCFCRTKNYMFSYGFLKPNHG